MAQSTPTQHQRQKQRAQELDISLDPRQTKVPLMLVFVLSIDPVRHVANGKRVASASRASPEPSGRFLDGRHHPDQALLEAQISLCPVKAARTTRRALTSAARTVLVLVMVNRSAWSALQLHQSLSPHSHLFYLSLRISRLRIFAVRFRCCQRYRLVLVGNRSLISFKMYYKGLLQQGVTLTWKMADWASGKDKYIGLERRM